MIPLRDTIRSRTYPVARNAIIALNILAYLWELSQGPALQRLFYFYGLVPVRYSNLRIAAHFSLFEQLMPFFTSMFLHAGFLHILGNMWFLYIFGDNVEDRLGAFRFFLFYLLSGVVAASVQLATNWHSQLPTVGASGAIAGVMGAYIVLYPRSRILTLVPIFFIPYFIELPAFFFLGYWALIQFLYGAMSQGQAQTGGVAWWAHVGGFVFGLATVKIFESIPRTGVSEMASRYTQRRSTPRLQQIRPTWALDDLDTHATLVISPREAEYGTRKIIHAPYRRRTLMVNVPAGAHDGMRLRLRGMGRKSGSGDLGDLYLTIRIGRIEA